MAGGAPVEMFHEALRDLSDTPAVQTLGALGAEDLSGQIVFLRIDGSIPIDASPELADEKLKLVLPSLDLLTSAGSRIVLLSHSDAAGAELNKAEAHRAVCRRLSFLFGRPIACVDHCRGEEVLDALGTLRDGEALMLGNLALEPAERENSPELAHFLAGLSDVYCDEAFSLAHEVLASTVGAARMAQLPVAGLEFERALGVLSGILDEPVRPFLAVFGGSLSISSLLLLESVAIRADVVLVGGEVCLPFLKADDRPTGAAAVPDEAVEIAARILADSRSGRRTLLVPQDFVTVDNLDPLQEFSAKSLRTGEWPATLRLSSADSIGPNQVAGDIGIDTRRTWGEQLPLARTVFWHGPLGICESQPLAAGTFFFAGQIASRTWRSLHRTVICGESLAGVLRSSGFPHELVDYFSPAGTAIMHYAARRPLPALEALRPPDLPQKRSPTVLVALAGMDDDLAVAAFAASCFPETAAIHCIYVETGPDENRYPDIYAARTKSERLAECLRAERIFARAEAAMASQGLTPASRILVHGDPSDLLIRCAGELGADVIVMRPGGAKSSGYSRKRVVAESPCQVLILQGQT